MTRELGAADYRDRGYRKVRVGVRCGNRHDEGHGRNRRPGDHGHRSHPLPGDAEVYRHDGDALRA